MDDLIYKNIKQLVEMFCLFDIIKIRAKNNAETYGYTEDYEDVEEDDLDLFNDNLINLIKLNNANNNYTSQQIHKIITEYCIDSFDYDEIEISYIIEIFDILYKK